LPQRLFVVPDGWLGASGAAEAIEEWWQPRPLLLCPRCRAAYDLRATSDFRKLVTLSQTGRSTATTVLGAGAILGLRRDDSVPAEAQKLASLQAGHLNDFTQVVLLRGALLRALDQARELSHDRVGDAVFRALDPAPEDFMKEPVPGGPGHQQAVRAMVDLLEHRLLEDLARAWRVAQPNLEQCGLLHIHYDGLAELASDDMLWQSAPPIGAASAGRREIVLAAVLDHLRSVLARVAQTIRDLWALDERERLRIGSVALLAGVVPDARDHQVMLRLGARSSIGRYLRSRRTWDLDHDLDSQQGEALVGTIIAALRGHPLTVVSHRGSDYGVQVKVGSLRWERGNGTPPKSLHLRRQDLRPGTGNRYFTDLYRDRALGLRRLSSADHTGQVPAELRIEREEKFVASRLLAVTAQDVIATPGRPALAGRSGGEAIEAGLDAVAVSSYRSMPPMQRHFTSRNSSMPPMQRYLTSRNSSMLHFEPSRPMPLSFMPPNGAISVEMMPSLMPTMPYSRASATRQMRPMSRL
jgi:hypothetical protein